MAQHFDVAVIGAQPAGLIAAALLAKRGRRVLLVDHGEDVGAYRRRGLRLPLVPTLVPALEGSPPIQRVHEELGLGPELRAQTKNPESSFQAVLPKHRLSIAPSVAATCAELKAEFPGLGGAIDDFFARLFALDEEVNRYLAGNNPRAPRGFFDKLKNGRQLSPLAHLAGPLDEASFFQGIPAGHPVREILLSPLAFFGYLPAETPSTLQAARLIARYFKGVVEFPDRLGGLNAVLTKAARDKGVELRRGVEVKRIDVEKKRVASFELEGDRMTYTADFVIASTVGPFEELLPAAAAKDEAGVRAVGSLMTLNLVVSSEVVPYGMAQALFLLNGRRQGREGEPVDPPVFLQRYPAQRGDSGPTRGKEAPVDERHEVFSAACPVRTAEVQHSPERWASLKAQLLERVGRVVPFLRDHLRDSSLPTEPGAWDLDSGAPRRIDPWRLHPFYEMAERPLLGVLGRSPFTGLKNLLYCGRELVPGLGIEGEYLGGLTVADEIVTLAGKKWKAL